VIDEFLTVSVVMFIGERYKVECEPLILAGQEMQFVQSMK